MATRSKRPPPVHRARTCTRTYGIASVCNPCACHHHGGARGSGPRSPVATGQRIPRVHGSVEELIARGAGLLALSDEKEAPDLRHYLPPNFTTRDRHVRVRS